MQHIRSLFPIARDGEKEQPATLTIKWMVELQDTSLECFDFAGNHTAAKPENQIIFQISVITESSHDFFLSCSLFHLVSSRFQLEKVDGI